MKKDGFFAAGAGISRVRLSTTGGFPAYAAQSPPGKFRDDTNAINAHLMKEPSAMPSSHTSVRCFMLALTISAFVGSVAEAQVVPSSSGEGNYTGDLTGPMIVNVNDRYGRTSLWVDGVLYGGSDKHPGTGNAIGFDHQFLAGGVSITDEPFESGPFETTKESTWGHVMRFQGTITNEVATGTWSLDYNEDSNDCRTASERNRSCTTRTGTFEIPLTPRAPLNTVQPLDLSGVCGGIGPMTASLSLLGIVTAVATRRRRRR